MAFDKLELAQTTPSEEPCAQVGSPNYMRNARIEAKVLRDQIIRENGTPPEGTFLETNSNPHDFGTYLDVAIVFDENNEEARNYAFAVESNVPQLWDEESKKQLDEMGYKLEE
jgi:hypothetical protein